MLNYDYVDYTVWVFCEVSRIVENMVSLRLALEISGESQVSEKIRTS